MNFIKKYFSFIAIVFLFLLPIVSFAGGNTVCDPSTHICNPIAENSIQGFIKTILEGALKIGIPIIALAVIYSGFLFVKAQGNSKELETAKNSLLYTMIGAGILLGAWAIAKLIADTVLSL